MAFLKLQFEKRKMAPDEHPEFLYERLRKDESALLQSGKYGRYSYIAYDPFALLWSENDVVQMRHKKVFLGEERTGIDHVIEGEPFEVLERVMKEYVYLGKSPVPFFGGVVGMFRYDFGVSLMDLNVGGFDEAKVPDYFFLMVDKVIAFDHEKNEIYFLGLGETEMAAQRKISEIKMDIQQPPVLKRKGGVGEIRSSVSRERYLEKIEAIQEKIRAGETYQVNFTQQLSAECTLDPWDLYQRLFTLNPAPFSSFFHFGDFYVVSSSPELLLRKRGKLVETWPIKGTVKRGSNEAEDRRQMDKLLASEKDRAELAMIIDLERNDLGKVCEVGSVVVKSEHDLELYSHVIHTVARIQGRLAYGKDFFDIWPMVFPGGSITGCPKIRTVQIIDAIEGYRRGIYTGSAGFLSFSGDADFNILIRTFLLKDRMVYFSTGGGITIGSEGVAEYEEAMAKVEALKRVLE